MDSFKSWLIANLEVILIILTILFLTFATIFAFSHSEEPFKGIYWDMLFFLAIPVIIICILSVSFIKSGFLATILLLFFLGMPILISRINADDKPTEKKAQETQVVQNQPRERTDVDIMLDGAVERVKWTWLLWAAIPAFLFGLVCAIYANRNFDDVVSRRFLFRNSEVSVFEVQWKYTFNRFYAGFVTVFAFALEIMLFLALKP